MTGSSFSLSARNTELLRHRVLRFLKNSARALLLACLLAGSIFTTPASANTQLWENFDVNPIDTDPTSFTTGTAATGMLFSCTDCEFAWMNPGYWRLMQAASEEGVSGSIRITSRDGKAFVFDQIYMYSTMTATTMTGIGPEPFTVHYGAGFLDQTTPVHKLVTEVVFTPTVPGEQLFFNFDNFVTTVDVPGMEVRGNGNLITSPGTTISTELGTLMASPIGTPVTQTFTINSIGEDPLDLTGSPYVTISGTVLTDVSILSQPTVDPIASGGSDTFTVQCLPSDAGDHTARLNIANNSEANAYMFWVNCVGLNDIEMDLQRPVGSSVANGGTDNIGPFQPGTQTLTYTIEDTGTYELTVSSPTFSSETNVSSLLVAGAPSSPVSGGGTTTFTVQFDVDAEGAFGFDMELVNDDYDENPYTIHVSGTGDSDLPAVTSFTRQTPASSPTNADELVFRAAFDEDMANVDTADFTVNGTSGAGVTGVTQVSPDTYDITVSGGDLSYFDGTVGVDLSGSQDITDLAGNALPAGEPSTDETYIVDNTQPNPGSVTRQTPASSPTNADTLVFQYTFDEDVTGVGTADFTVNGGSTASVTGVSPVSADTYDLTVSGGDLASWNNIVMIGLNSGQDIKDVAGNDLNPNPPNPNESYTLDNSAPSLEFFTLSAPSSSPTNADSLVFRAAFSEQVANVDAADFELNSTSTASITSVTAFSVDQYDITVSGGNLASFEGTVGIDLASGQDITDAVGNALPAGEPASDQTYTLDNIVPTPVITQGSGQADPASTLPIEFSVDFGEEVLGFEAADLVFGGTAPGTPAGTVSGGPDLYTVSISGLTGDGTVTLNLNTAAALDPAGNASAAPTLTDNTVTFDGDARLELQRPAGTGILNGFTDNLGSLAIGAEHTVTYILDNTNGTDALTITSQGTSSYVNVTGVSIDTPSASTIPGGGSSSLDLSFTIPVDGPFSFDLEVQSDDPVNSTYTITIAGTGTGGAVEIDIQRPAGTSIPDGGSEDLGPVDVGLIPLSYTIDNSAGTSELELSDVTAANLVNTSGIMLRDALPFAVPAGDTGVYYMEILTNSAGLFSMDLAFTNNDGDEANYTISLSGIAAMLAVTPTGYTFPTDGRVLYNGITELVVGFNKPVQSGGGADAADNTVNYMLAEAGENEVFDTATCAGGFVQDDVLIAIGSAVYDPATMSATLQVNGRVPLPYGSYRLWVCGTTSIEDLSGNELNEGLSDTEISFLLTSRNILPETGFAPDRITTLTDQPASSQYTGMDTIQLVIPSLDVQASIVGVPQGVDGWDVSWLGSRAGYLYGSAYPTWEGNTVLTGHVWDADNTPGLFYGLKSLRYGDRFEIRSDGQVYTYEVRENRLLGPGGVDQVFQHEELDWVTLLTCEDYNPASGQYLYRRAVRAVLVDVR